MSATAGRDALREALAPIIARAWYEAAGWDPDDEDVQTAVDPYGLAAADAVLAALDGLPDTPTDEGRLICKCGARRDGSVPHDLSVHEAYGQPLAAPAARPETDEPLRRADKDNASSLSNGMDKTTLDTAHRDGLRQVGWLGPYGLIPGGMDNDPVPSWRPVYVRTLAAGTADPATEEGP